MDDQLLGQPLAGPWRRAVALLVDGAAVATLANAPGLIFGVAVAMVLLRVSVKPAAGGFIRRSVRLVTRATTAVIVFAVALSLWNTVSGFGDDDDGTPAIAMGEGTARITGLQGIAAGREILDLVNSSDEEDAHDELDDVVDDLVEAGLDDEVLFALLQEVPPIPDRPWINVVVDSALSDLTARFAEPVPDSVATGTGELIAEYLGAEEAGDTVEMREVARRLGAVLAADSLAGLEARATLQERRADRLQEALTEEQEGGGLIAAFRTFAEDMGLGFGWTGLYFTAFTVLWRGQTPGKRLLGIRVVRLDRLPLGWFNSFERFAGYAAGLATGLLGFLQVFWDRNRQAIQDKIAGTVVIRGKPETEDRVAAGRQSGT